jgi:hypothetical protein
VIASGDDGSVEVSKCRDELPCLRQTCGRGDDECNCQVIPASPK